MPLSKMSGLVTSVSLVAINHGEVIRRMAGKRGNKGRNRVNLHRETTPATLTFACYSRVLLKMQSTRA